MRACDVMRSSFATVKPGTPLIEAVRLLLQNNQRCLPVCDVDQNVIGVLSEGDLLHRRELDIRPVPRSWFEFLLTSPADDISQNEADALSVQKVMSQDAVYVDEEASLDEIVGRMDLHRNSEVLVVCGSRVIGIVSRFEMIAALERKLLSIQGAEDQHLRQAG